MAKDEQTSLKEQMQIVNTNMKQCLDSLIIKECK